MNFKEKNIGSETTFRGQVEGKVCIRDFLSGWSGSLNLTSLSSKEEIYVLGFEKKFGYEVKFFVHGKFGTLLFLLCLISEQIM